MTSPLLTGSLQNSSLAPIVPPSVGKVVGGGRGEEGKVEGQEWEGKAKREERGSGRKGGRERGEERREDEGERRVEGREGKGGRERKEGREIE